MSDSFQPRLDILPAPQQRLWPELIDVPSWFTLYGGTALALHLGHRESIDFDFFGTELFDPDQLLGSVDFMADAKIVQKSGSTLSGLVDRGGSVLVSFFGVPKIRNLKTPHRTIDNHLQIATKLDLGASKASEVQKRAEAKDYIDIDALILDGAIDLPRALAAARAKYGKQFNPELTLKALCFFGNGNLDTVPENARQRLATAVAAVDLANLSVLPI